MNGHRRKLAKVLSDPAATVLVVGHRDRLTRFGFEHLAASLAACGRRIVVLDEAQTVDDLVRCRDRGADQSVCSAVRAPVGFTSGRRSCRGSHRQRADMSQMVIQAYRFALDPTPGQVRDLERHAGAARFAFNWSLAAVKANLAQREAERSYAIADAGLTPRLRWDLPRAAPRLEPGKTAGRAMVGGVFQAVL